MTTIDYSELSKNLCDGLRSAFNEVMAANPERTFYTFGLWTDDSLQFANACANTEEGLEATVERYRREVDPKYDTTSTIDGMRWCYGDWEFFPIDGEHHLYEVNSILTENFTASEEVFERQIEPLWQALLQGFKQLNDDGFFGAGDDRSKITLLVVGHVSDEIVDHWAKVLNPDNVASKFIDWDCG